MELIYTKVDVKGEGKKKGFPAITDDHNLTHRPLHVISIGSISVLHIREVNTADTEER